MKAPIASLAHGKTIGGGVATACFGKYRSADPHTTFCVGNLSRAANPLFLLSLALRAYLGTPAALEHHLLDATEDAQTCLVKGLVTSVCVPKRQGRIEELALVGLQLTKRTADLDTVEIEHRL